MNHYMTFNPSKAFKKENPTLVKYSQDMLFNEVWLDETLSSKERSLVTLSVLATIGNTEQMPYHLQSAYTNGVTRKELMALTTHLAFYIGWPSAVQLLNQIIAESFGDADE